MKKIILIITLVSSYFCGLSQFTTPLLPANFYSTDSPLIYGEIKLIFQNIPEGGFEKIHRKQIIVPIDSTRQKLAICNIEKETTLPLEKIVIYSNSDDCNSGISNIYWIIKWKDLDISKEYLIKFSAVCIEKGKKLPEKIQLSQTIYTEANCKSKANTQHSADNPNIKDERYFIDTLCSIGKWRKASIALVDSMINRYIKSSDKSFYKFEDFGYEQNKIFDKENDDKILKNKKIPISYKDEELFYIKIKIYDTSKNSNTKYYEGVKYDINDITN